MKYWKGVQGTKSGQYGTYDDDGHVPDGVECMKGEYEAYVASQPPREDTIFDKVSKLILWAKTKGYEGPS